MGLRSLIKRGVKEAAKASPAGQALTTLEALRGKKEGDGSTLSEMITLMHKLLTDDDGLVARVDAIEKRLGKVMVLLLEDDGLVDTVRGLEAVIKRFEDRLCVEQEIRRKLEARVAKFEGGE